MTKELKYEFKLEIQKVYLKIPSECNVQIWWRRGKGKVTTKNPVKLKGKQSYFKVNQTLAIQGKCSLRHGTFEKKESLIQIVIFNFDNTTKLGGACTVDLANILSATNVTMNHSQNFQLPLENTPDSHAKIQFTLSVKYLGECSDQSANDISFQGNLNHNSSDMTFRASSKERKTSYRKSDTNSENIYKSQSPIHMPQKYNRHQKTSGEKPMQFSFNPKVDPEREKQNRAHLEMISELRQEISQKIRQNQRLKDQLRRMEDTQRKNQNYTSEKNLSLMNELNVATSKAQQYKRELRNMEKMQRNLKQLERANDEITRQKQEYAHNLSLKKKQLQHANDKLRNIEMGLQEKRRGEGQISKRLHEAEKQNSNLKQQVFRKQSQCITLENKLQKEVYTVKQKTNQLMIISEQLNSIKLQQSSFQHENNKLKKLMAQKAQQVQRANSLRKQAQDQKQAASNARMQAQDQLHSHKSTRSQLQEQVHSLKLIKQQLQQQIKDQNDKIRSVMQDNDRERDAQRRKYQLLEQSYKEKMNILKDIQDQFSAIQKENIFTIKEKQQRQKELTNMREKYQSLELQMQGTMRSQESNNILVSQLKVKVKNLQSACDSLQKQIDEKDDIIREKDNVLEKAKNYVKQKQRELEQRDQFIQNAKNFVKEREEQFEQEKRKLNEYAQSIKTSNNLSNKQAENLRIRVKDLTEQVRFLEEAAREKQVLKRKVNELTAETEFLSDNARQKQILMPKIDQLKSQIQFLESSNRDKQRELRQCHAQLNSAQLQIRDYMSNINEKDRQIRQLRDCKQNLNSYERQLRQLRDCKTQVLQCQQQIRQLKDTLNEKCDRNQDLEHFIQSLHQRIQITQDELEQVNRKNKGLNETLQEIVRKNFDMQIQLNVKQAELQAVRSYQ